MLSTTGDKKVSIIIPVKRINEYINESIPHIFNLDYDDFEVFILLDKGDLSEIKLPPERLKFLFMKIRDKVNSL